MEHWEVYYYKKANYYYLLIIPFLLAVFAPMFFATLKPGQFAAYEPYFEIALIAGAVLFGLGFIGVWRLKTKKHKAKLILQNGRLGYLNNEINLTGYVTTFGKYGLPATGSLGTVLYLKNAGQLLRIGIIQHTLKNANSYTEPWSMKVDCFLEKRDLEPLLKEIGSVAQAFQPQAQSFSADETVFELRGVVKPGNTFLLFYAFIAVPIILMLVFSISNPIAITVMMLSAIGAFIYYKIKQDTKGKGFFLVFSNGLVKLRNLDTRHELCTVPQTSVTNKVYLKTISGRNGSHTWLILELNLPGIKKITIGRPGPLGKNIWKKSGLPEKRFTFSTPQFLVDGPTWNKLANTLGVPIPTII